MRRWDRQTWIIIGVIVAGLVALAAYVLFAVRAEDTENELAETEQQASESALTIQKLCRRGDQVAVVLHRQGACRQSEDVISEVNDPDPDDPERQDREIQQPERQDPEVQQTESQEPEQQDSETQDPEVQDPENGNSEVQDSEIQNTEVQNPESQEPEIQDPETQEPEVDDPEPNDDRCGAGFHPDTRQVDQDGNPGTPPQTWQVCVAD